MDFDRWSVGASFGRPEATDYRNPVLASAAKDLSYVQRFGSGIPRASQALRRNGNRALMPLAQAVPKPMFLLKPADGAFGGHQQAVAECRKAFRDLADNLPGHCNITTIASTSGSRSGAFSVRIGSPNRL
ncbi:MAG TPA: hypothetical protein VHU42_12335 [Rhodopila sp.]|nr:hypothetical protein [Rhodopila sp.]